MACFTSASLFLKYTLGVSWSCASPNANRNCKNSNYELSQNEEAYRKLEYWLIYCVDLHDKSRMMGIENHATHKRQLGMHKLSSRTCGSPVRGLGSNFHCLLDCLERCQ